MPENKVSLTDPEAVIAEIRTIVTRYMREIDKQVQEAKDRKYGTWENVPQQEIVETQNVTKPEEGRSLGIFPAPVRDKKPKKVIDGGEI